MDAVALLQKTFARNDLPDVRPGDTVKIFQSVKEGDKTRIQPFEGLVIAKKHGSGAGATITIRKVTAGIGVERIFPLSSPTIQKIEIVKRSNVRRAKLYYIRGKASREARKKMKQERATLSAAAEHKYPENA